MIDDNLNIPVNEFLTPITKETFAEYPEEVYELFMDFITSVPYIKYLISPDRKRAKDMPRDKDGKIIVDIAHPHILENMDYFRPSAIHFEKHGCYTFLRPNPNPNSEYKKWFDEEKRRCREGYVRESDGEWVTGYMYWYINYCPIMLTKILAGKKKAMRTEGFPLIWEGVYLRFHYLDLARNAGKHAIELARRGAHPYFLPVFTPEGWKTWEEIKVGSKLFTTYGTECTVVDIPYDKESPYYKITLRDGRVVYATDDHLWNIIKKGKLITVNTAWLLLNYKHSRVANERIPSGIEHNCFIPKNSSIELPYKKTQVDPYTFGLMLGDGCFRVNFGYFTLEDKDLEVERKFIPYDIIKYQNKYTYKIDIPGWKTIISNYNLYYVKSELKFIPDEYKYNSKEVRLNLLRGLLDSDGYVHGGVPVLTSTSLRLIEDTAFIARSLGYNTKWVKCKAGYRVNGEYKRCSDCYELSIYGGKEVFNLPRKQALVKYTSGNAKSRRDKTCIVNIEYAGVAPCKCVTVNSVDNCYLVGDFITTHNCGKSFSLASMMAKNLILGENKETTKRVTTILTAYLKEYLADKEGTLSKFEPMINFIADNTEFPRLRLRSSSLDMFWQMGYIDENGRKKGSLNSVMGVSSKDDEAKLRGKRGHIYFEEMGSFKGLLSIYDTVRYGMEEGDYTYGLAYLVGTSAEDASDFESAKILLYNTEGYNLYGIENVYDKPKQGRPSFGYFFPAFVNRLGCFNEDGVSDVVKALLQILMNRYVAKYSSDPNSVLRVIAEMPITPAEAIIKVRLTYFPTIALTERLQQLDADPRAFDDIYVGLLFMDSKTGLVKFISTDDTPIRKWGVENTNRGALEIYLMPQKNNEGLIYPDRYIIGHDPVDNDLADSKSLSSTFVLDLFTDKIVAEYTGRQEFADDNFEIVRLLCLFYNAKCLYEAHPYDQKVITPDGVKKWGEINIGDYLFDPVGGKTKVIDIPIDGEDDIYKITLLDGRSVEASSNHIWLVYKLGSKTPLEVTTIEIVNSGVINKHGLHKYYIPKLNSVEFLHKEVPIDPYTLGLLIAEGAFTKFPKEKVNNKSRRTVQFSSCKEDAEFYKTTIPYEIKYIGNKGYSWHMYIDDIDIKLKSLGLLHCNSHTKFIPDLYLYNDKHTRIELLKGLMDGDGCAVQKGASVFITTSKQLSEDIKLLCYSLGITAYNNKGGSNHYRVAIAAQYPIFKLPRKIKKLHVYTPNAKGSKANSFLNKTAITSIEYVGKKKCKCVTVDNPNGLYLIGDYVTTHNCNKKGLFAYFSRLNCTHLLADTPEYLRDKLLVKYSAWGSNAKGVNASAGVNDYANRLIRDWLLKPVVVQVDDPESGEKKEVTISNLYTLRNRALIEELIGFAPEVNVDRVRSLGMVMLLREEKMILYLGNLDPESRERNSASYLGNDDFFTRNYDQRVNSSYKMD